MTIKPAISKLFDQLTFVLEHIPNEQYTAPVAILSGATIGQHTRHLLEFMKCLLAGRQGRMVNYDLRDRDIFLENNTLEAVTLIAELRRQIEQIQENEDLVLELSYGDNSELRSSIETNLYREIVYNIEHAIHHMALIKIGLNAVCPGLVLPEGFGVASSTIRYQRAQTVRA